MKIIFGLLLATLLAATYTMGPSAYNMAATEKHWVITEKIIEWFRLNSIAARTKDLEIPTMDAQQDVDYLTTGATHYDAMCTDCHLAPGQEPTELAQGLYPQAPVFYQRTPITDQAESQEQVKAYFWVIKNGIKMTAMPAWGLTHDDETIWAMAFFVQNLGGMSENRYHALSAKHSSADDSDHDHGHDHQHTQHEKHQDHSHDH